MPPWARFCAGCGRPVRAGVAASGRFGAPDTYTPRRLAERILHDRRALEGERKEVTVLFADLRGSMELIADRDAEQARDVLDRVLELMMEAVHRYEGTVNQVMGDGVMAIFGAPVAHEDHAVRACYAALRMQDSLGRWAEEARRDLGIAVAVRIGLNSGEVLVRAIDNDLHMDYTAVGTATHLAARFEQMAVPGTTLLSAQTAALASGFIETRALGPVVVRGLKEPVLVFELTGATTVRTRLQRAATQGLTRFVGREGEVQALQRAAMEARRGHGRAVGIVGEPGVGKSRLMWELARALAADGWLVLEGRCLSYDRSSAYAPIIEMLRGYFDVQRFEDTTTVTERMASRLLALDASLTVFLPAFQALLDVPVEDGRWRGLDPLERRRAAMDAVLRLLLRESQGRPVLVAIDDLQWVDADSQTLLDAIVDAMRPAPVLVLVGHRPEYDAPWSGRAHGERLRLEPLSTESSDLLLDALVGQAPELAPLRRLLVARTDGNPFFLEESVAMLVTEGILGGERGRYRLARPPAGISIPSTVRAVIAARIDQLAPDDKRLLEAAAVVGKDVPLAVLHAVAEVDEEDLHAGLARLRAAEFLYESRLFPEIEYAFKHPLTHEVTYKGLAHDRRRTMHGRVLGALMEEGDGARRDERVGILGSHAFRAERWEEAVTWLRRAGARAALRSASAEAVARFEQALEALAHLPRTRAHLELGMDIRFELRNPLFLLADFPRALAVLEEVSAVAEASADDERLGRASAFMANAHFMLGNVERGIDLARRSTAIGEARRDAALLAFSSCHLGQLRYVSGDHPGAVAAMTTCLEWLGTESVQRRPGLVKLYGVVAECFVAFAEAARGRLAEAGGAAGRCAAIADASGAPFYQALALWARGAVALARNDVEGGLAALDRARAACDGADIRSIRPWIDADLGLALLLRARAPEAVALLDHAVREATSLQLLAGQSVRYERLALAMHAVGKARDAHAVVARAMESATRHGEHGFRASILRTLGTIERAMNDLDGARRHLEDALTLALGCDMRPLAAHCHLDLGLVYARGDETAARASVAVGLALLRDLGLTPPGPLAAELSALPFHLDTGPVALE